MTEPMSKPEFWWCVKWKTELLPWTARKHGRQLAKNAYEEDPLGGPYSVVRIRVEEVGRKKP
jgi:hypothetical protein